MEIENDNSSLESISEINNNNSEDDSLGLCEAFQGIEVEELASAEELPFLKCEKIYFQNSLIKEIDEKIFQMTPIEIFFYFYNEFLDKILEFSKGFERNIYGVINYKFTKMDLYKYIFIHIYISLYNVPEIKMLWDKDIMFLSIVLRIITKKNYEKINKYFFMSKYYYS